ncbi:MAG: leucyl aminopeptidase family protein [Alphaproteobacteria bacterium]|nr:leucyl aminopeptidase family protein [Alphaproteobacteria bacterium]
MARYVVSSAIKGAVPLLLLSTKEAADWLGERTQTRRDWLKALGFEGKPQQRALIPDAEGNLERVVAVVDAKDGIWALAHLPATLPEGKYTPEAHPKGFDLQEAAIGWELATYRFKRSGKEKPKSYPTLVVPKTVDLARVDAFAEGIILARDLVNRPANDLTPYALAEAAKAVAKQHGAKFKVLKDKELLDANYPLIHAVGRASDNRPCLVDFQWGDAKAPKVTLVGKGVCFDSGGLDIKPSGGMLLMKKDMGGAATVLGLAHAIMALKLPVRLRVLIPAVENSISANAFRPMDIITSRKGLTVEIGNTDAEGRLILSDALAEADTEKPDLLIDFATLTGACRVALGADIPGFFTDDDKLAADITKASAEKLDALWRLPLWEGYRDNLNSDAADLNSASGGAYGGAITAALYLKEFVEQAKSWVHIDLMAWNQKSRPGRPMGGEAMGLRAIFAMLEARYGKPNKK